MRKLIKSILPNKILNSFRAYRETQKQKTIDASLVGDQVFCPICESSFSGFGEYGLVKRANASCHNCASLERHRLVFLYLTVEINVFEKQDKPIRILHFAPEKMFYEKFDKAENVKYTCCDLSPELYNFEGKTKVTKVDITNIPFEDGSFDLILCNHVLEHIPDDNLAMKELLRVMAENGNGIFQVPIDASRKETYEDWTITAPEERAKAFGQYDHVRWYGQDYGDKLKNAGFLVNEVDYPASFSSNDIFKFGLVESEKVFHVKK